MIFIIYFVLGIFFYQVISPVLDELVSLFISFIESIKGGFSIKIAKANSEAILITNSAQEEDKHTSVIGFTVPTQPEEEELEEEDPEDE